MDMMETSSQLKSSESSIDKHKKDKKKDSKKKKRKRSRSSSSSRSSESEETKRRKRAKKKAKKLKKKLKKKDKKGLRKAKEMETNVQPPKSSLPSITTTKSSTSIISPGPEPVPPTSADTSAYKPMTFEEWTKKRNTYKHVIDPETGRKRLVRGDGEIVEECVSRDRQKAINKLATQTDGWVFHKTSLENVSKK